MGIDLPLPGMRCGVTELSRTFLEVFDSYEKVLSRSG